MPYRGPGIYRHYKGGEYLAIGMGVEEATLTPVVIYRPRNKMMPDDVRERTGVQVTYWTRPLESFNGDVLVPDAKGIDMTAARFAFVSGPPMSDLP